MCQVSLLKSHSTDVICHKDQTQIDCSQSVFPGVIAKVTCNPRYQSERNAQEEFVCRENGKWNGAISECKADCGRLVPKAAALTVDGKEANPHELPWYAGIYHKNNQICGGTIISGLFLNSSFSLFLVLLNFLFTSRINCLISSSLF